MAADLRQVVENLSGFYDFGGRDVVVVGAGGGQLLEFARPARKVLAVDKDAGALERLARRVAEAGLGGTFTLRNADLLELEPWGDVVVLEFCLHEMPDPARALAHARRVAPEVVAIDHAPESPWSWCAAEEREVEAGWRALEALPIRRQAAFECVQRFADYRELEAKLADQGPESRARIAPYRGRRGISIAMPYRLALL
jgi:SAM-dependent methyltransferase